jgi:hypothetical protein
MWRILRDEGIEVVDLLPDSFLIQINSTLGKAIEFAVEHAHEIVVGIGDDAFRDPVPQRRDGEPPQIVRIGGLVGLAEELESIDGIKRMPRSFAKGPASLVTDWVYDRHADHAFQFLEFTHNDRPMRPGAGPRDIEVVATARCLVAGVAICGYPVGKSIRLSDEGAFEVLLIWKLCLDGHRLAPAFLYRIILQSDKGAAWSSSCSRNAHDKNVLVRRAHSRIDQAALRGIGKRAWKDHLEMEEDCSMPAGAD